MAEKKSGGCEAAISGSQKQIRFVKEGTVVRKKKKKTGSYWGEYKDWKILVDTKMTPYQIPACIASTNLRPDICIYSEEAKKVCFSLHRTAN